MEFTLHYRGELRANGRPAEKHRLRRHFHAQLVNLWQQNPLNSLRAQVLKETPDPGESSILQSLGGFVFAPLVNQNFHALARIRIRMLRPEPPGRIVTQGGDIDNRIKTLLDSLKMPRHENELPPGAAPESNENPFFCLLEDDNLISRLAVEADRLLEPGVPDSEVVLLINVQTERSASTFQNLDF